MNDLDERIAIEIMGWKVEQKTVGDVTAKQWLTNKSGGWIKLEDWNPTTDANDVFGKDMLLDKMEEFGLFLRLTKYIGSTTRAGFYRHNIVLAAESTSLYRLDAICTASLKALEAVA